MKESYQKGVANHLSPELCLDGPRGRGEALTGGSVGELLSSENTKFRRLSVWSDAKATQGTALMLVEPCSGGVEGPRMRGHFLHGNRETSDKEICMEMKQP